MIRVGAKQIVDQLHRAHTEGHTDGHPLEVVFDPFRNGLAREAETMLDDVAGIKVQCQSEYPKYRTDGEDVHHDGSPMRSHHVFSKISYSDAPSGINKPEKN